MKLFWTLLKIVLGLALAIPLSILVLGTALGIFGALLGIAILVLRIALVGLVVWGAYRLLARLFRGPAPRASMPEMPRLAPVDPHYEAAMRELDRELGEDRRVRNP
ncbi:MAG: hypothetical protein WD801_12765 [Gemmatimonadaceae bacterium]